MKDQLTWLECKQLLDLIAESGEADRNSDLRGIYQKIQLQMSSEVFSK